ncbi:hypothetical protein POP15_048 [Pectobacterium phage POP15]|nr:hypothetical protein POP15_048 [Pectobacterium phage POP15]
MLKVLKKFAKVIALLTVMILLNPHRALLIPLNLLALGGSWLAGKLEDGCQWVDGNIKYLRTKMWVFGRPIGDKLDEEMTELNRLVAEIDKRFKEG